MIGSVDPGVPEYVVGDVTRLRQILVNLLGNAVKFTEHGEVALEVGLTPEVSDGLGLHFTVRDTGIGIPKEKQQLVFEAFTQDDGSTTRKYGGTGLGLTISARLVEAMKGKIWVESDPGAVRALAYDVVLNGTELGSGSIRIHRQDIQSTIFKALGMSPEEQQARFGFFLEALQYGTPPHGGIALGLDRIVMILAGADSLREVIPFPKTAKAIDLMMDAPTPVSDRQLKELGIAVVPKRDL